jgi:hypothetical protein
MSRQGATQTHYESHTADSYESAFFYEPGDYMDYLCRLVQERLHLLNTTAVAQRRVLLDVGGGTGNFTRMIIDDSPNTSAIVVDPYLEKSADVSSDSKDHVTFIPASAEVFKEDPGSEATWRKHYHQVLMKEVVHHFSDADRVPIFRGLWRGLVPTTETGPPSLLIITRPQRDIDYPLWEEARKVWAQHQPSLEQFVDELQQAGFTNVQNSLEAYPCEIRLERWHQMVKARFWSTFANFSDQELEAACKTIDEAEKERICDGILHFEDRLLFITAKKLRG